MNIYQAAYNCLMLNDVEQKRQQTHALYEDWKQHKYHRNGNAQTVERIDIPGRPDRPELVPPGQVKQRKLSSEEGRATLIHAITHIEFNAINLALDAIYRFRDMPDDYYTDWLQVASEEAYHFGLLHERLQKLGYRYGDMPAHNGLWEMTIKTDHDVMVRMALVPRVLEARGLDVTPGMMKRLESIGDHESVAALKIILRDEIGHVAIGSRWFHYCCAQRSLESRPTFRKLLLKYMKGPLRGPFYTEARLKAGFTEQELQELLEMDAQ